MVIRVIIKFILDIVFLIVVLPFYLVYVLSLSNTRVFTGFAELFSLFPGYLGYFIRKAFYKLSLRKFSEADIGFGTILQYASIKLGSKVYIGQNCNIAKCTIGTGAKIGSNVHIVNKDTHDIGEEGEILDTNVRSLKRVLIGKNSWIGNNSVIMADVGENCIIGAGSVVVKNILSNSIAVGNPAKVVKRK